MACVEQLKTALVDRRSCVVHRTDQRELVGHGCELGEQLAQMQARNLRLDRFKRTPDLRRSFRLGVECVDMTGTTDHVDEDATLGGAEWKLRTPSRDAGNGQTGRASSAGLQKFAARRSLGIRHVSCPSW